MKVAIIGSGIGGICSAIRLKKKGFDVDVFEKNEFPGGNLKVLNFPPGNSFFSNTSTSKPFFFSLIAEHIPPIPDPIIATFMFKSLAF